MKIGLFDEDFFAYGDDAEIGIRARLAGWKCLYVPKAVLYHKNSGSTGQYSPFKAFYVERNRFWITIKYFPLPLLFLSTLFYTLSVCFSGIWGSCSPRSSRKIYKDLFTFPTGRYFIEGLWFRISLSPEDVEEKKEWRYLQKVTYRGNL